MHHVGAYDELYNALMRVGLCFDSRLIPSGKTEHRRHLSSSPFLCFHIFILKGCNCSFQLFNNQIE